MHHSVRLRTEEREEELSKFAQKSADSRGRATVEDHCPIRTDFQRDRDRIIHSNAFRRLKHKTQVFVAPLGDHFVTRLTHTLEVSQIARTISRALNLNEDLTEAIALGHDLGHTPFGHTGEEVLNELLPEGFRHNEQSLRVVDLLEKYGQGLNLTWEVRDGILNHSKSSIGILGEGWWDIATVEGQVVKIADIVAYINHDTGDALRAGIITEQELPADAVRVLGNSSSSRINTLVLDIVAHSLDSFNDTLNQKPAVGMSDSILTASNELRDFLFNKVYNSGLASKEKDRAKDIVHMLYTYYLQHDEELPDEYRLRDDGIERKVADYIAGMTDLYAMHKAEEIKKL
ncbi:MAG: deoxyguanosinetriphosphate triphosphohydrolase [Dehalococcoidia bacterium]